MKSALSRWWFLIVVPISVALVAGCDGGGGGGGLDGVTAGQAVSTNPAEGAANVPPGSTITVTFSKTADPDSIGGEIDPLIEYDLSWSADNTTLTITPVEDLEPGTTYTVTIYELWFTDGTPLQPSCIFSFTVGTGDDDDGNGNDLEDGTTPSDKWELWSSGQTRLRGADLHFCRLFATEQGPTSCAELITRQDVQDLKDLGANLINASYSGLFTEQPPYEVDTTAQEHLDNLVGWAEEIGIYVVIHPRTGPGRNEAAITGGDALTTVWTDQAAHDAWIDMWGYMAGRYHDSPAVVGYNLMVEPHVNAWLDPEGTLTPEAFQEQHEGTLADWNALAGEITTAIREVDPDTPIIVNSLHWGSASWFPALEPTGDSRTVYSLHTYDPDVYTNQETDPTISYPSVVEDEGETINFDRSWLENNLQPAVEFSQQHGVPIYVGEFGAFRWVPGAVTFVGDEIDLFEQYGWNYAYYVWRGEDVGFDGFNIEYGTDPQNSTRIPTNPLQSVFTTAWVQNADFPTVEE